MFILHKDDTWEPVGSLSCPDKIQDYEDSKDDGDEQYDVEKIMGEKIEFGKRFFLVKWKGWAEKDNSWEPEESIECFDLVDIFRDSCRSVKPKASKQSPVKKAKATKYVKKGKSGSEKRGRPKKKAKKQESDDDDEGENENDEEEQEDNDEENGTGDDTEWDVEKILKERDVDGKKEYLIRWKGCKPADDTWEPEESVDNCRDLLTAFLKKKKK